MLQFQKANRENRGPYGSKCSTITPKGDDKKIRVIDNRVSIKFNITRPIRRPSIIRNTAEHGKNRTQDVTKAVPSSLTRLGTGTANGKDGKVPVT